VLRPQGRRGEVLAELHTDFPERFNERGQLSGLAADGNRRYLQLEEHWFHKGGVVLKFAGVESISDAGQLAGMELQVPSAERAKLEAGAAYVSEIVGCEVWVTSACKQQLLGTVAEVQFGAGEAPLLVVRNPRLSLREKGGAPEGTQEQEFLVPYAEEFVTAANFTKRRIEMHLPEGLLELDDPLSAEEKQQQESEADEIRAAGVRRKQRK
jgi:16S rRNA processing protein RimM